MEYNQKEISLAIRAVQSEGAEKNAINEIWKIKKRLISLCETLDNYKPIKYTGDFVLLKKVNGEYKFLGIFNPEKCDEDKFEWDLALPIPKDEFIKEFEGW